MDEKIRLKLQKAMQQRKGVVHKAIKKELDDEKKPEVNTASAKEIVKTELKVEPLPQVKPVAPPPKKQTSLSQAKDVLAYQNALEELQKDLEKLEHSLTEGFQNRLNLESQLEGDPKNKAILKEIQELNKQIASQETSFKEKQQDFFVLQESITYFNAGKKFLPSDWEIDPRQMEPIHKAFIAKIESYCPQLPQTYHSKSNLLLNANKYLEAISIASNINLTLAQIISDEGLQDKLDKLYHDYVKVIIIASGKEQSTYADLVREYCQKLPMRTVGAQDFTEVSFNLFNAYHMLCHKITGELALSEEDKTKVLSLFITDVFAQKINDFTKKGVQLAEIEVPTLYSQLEDLNTLLIKIIQFCKDQKMHVSALATEIGALHIDSALPSMLEDILAQATTISTSLDNYAQPATVVDDNFILSLLDNINLLFIFPHEILLILDEYHTEHQTKNNLCDINTLNTLHQTLQTLMSYPILTHIKHAIVETAQKLSGIPAILSEIKAIDMLKNVDLNILHSLVLAPILTQQELFNELSGLIGEYNLAPSRHKLTLSQDKLQQFDNNLEVYQDVLTEISHLKKDLLANPHSLEALENMYELIKSAKSLGKDYYMLRDLRVLLDHTEEDLLSDDNKLAFKKMHKYLNKEANLEALILRIFYHLENKQQLHQNVIALKIAQGDLFMDENKEELENIVYTLIYEVSPITLIHYLKSHFQNYDSIQQLNCVKFVKRYLLLDKNHSLVFINFKDSQFIKDMIEFNQFILTTYSEEAELCGTAQEINELLMTKILEKENIFTENMTEISEGKVHSSLLARNMKNLYHDISQNSNNIAFIKDSLTEVDAIIQAPNLYATSRQIGEKIITTARNICQALSHTGLFEEHIDSIMLHLDMRQKNKNPDVFDETPLKVDIPEYNLDEILNTISQERVDEQHYAALLDEFVDNIEAGYQKYFCDITYPEILQYVLQHDINQVEKGFAPKAPHVRQYNMYNQLIKDYCQLMVFYDHKTH